ncbi:uncharacterized protein ISCGN_002941 [Ixodes scapularis]
MSQASRLRQIFIQVLVIAWTIHTKPYQRADNLPLPIGASASLQLPYARLILPPLDTSRFDGTAWQPQLAPDNHKLQKPLPGTSSEGPGTDMSQASRLRQIFIQVGLFYKPVDHHSARRYLSVPSPFAFVFVLCHLEAYSVYVTCVLCYAASIVIRIMLLLSGNVEMNPGPFTQEQTKRILEVLELLPGIHKNQDVILAEMAAIKQTQTSVEEKLTSVFSTLESLKKDVTSLKSLETKVQQIQVASTELAEQFNQLANSHDDLENRYRRNNLIFYGVNEDTNETWATSETKVLQLCETVLGIKIDHSHVERAHRLGRHNAERSRPIIVNLSSFKTKQTILSQTPKLKNSGISIGEDFSANVRHERSKLLGFARTQNSQFKLRYNKLIIGNKVFYYENSEQRVKEKTI